MNVFLSQKCFPKIKDARKRKVLRRLPKTPQTLKVVGSHQRRSLRYKPDFQVRQTPGHAGSYKSESNASSIPKYKSI